MCDAYMIIRTFGSKPNSEAHVIEANNLLPTFGSIEHSKWAKTTRICRRDEERYTQMDWTARVAASSMLAEENDMKQRSNSMVLTKCIENDCGTANDKQYFSSYFLDFSLSENGTGIRSTQQATERKKFAIISFVCTLNDA